MATSCRRGQRLGGGLGGAGVSQPQTRHAINLGKSARHDHAIVVQRTFDERSIVRTDRDKVVVGLVYQNVCILRQLLDEVFSVTAGREISRAIVWISNLYKR